MALSASRGDPGARPCVCFGRARAAMLAAMTTPRASTPAPRAAVPDSSGTALCAAVAVEAADGAAPDWVHLIPAGRISTQDGRGPYRVDDPEALARASLPEGGRLPVDECHATDLAAPEGRPAPARGWIVELQARADGVWGRVEWTEAGRALVEGRAYRALSPVITHRPDGAVTAILRASLVNAPNLRGLAALHQEETEMDLLERLLAALGLPAGTTAEQAVERVAALRAAQDAGAAALQAALAPIAEAAGLAGDADATAVLAGVRALKGGDVAALQAELSRVTTELNGVVAEGKRRAAETFVDGAIAAGRVGVKPLRDRYVSMHMADPAGTEELIGAMPVLDGAALIPGGQPPAAEGAVALNAAQRQAAALLGLDPAAYAETLKREAAARAARI